MKLPRFNIRDLFWLVLVAGVGCAWWLERQQKQAAVRRAYRLDCIAHDLRIHLEDDGWNVRTIEAEGRVEIQRHSGEP